MKQESASDIIIKAYNDGRHIIPFLGSGVSVGTGFPTMAAITTYLAKVRFYIGQVRKWDRGTAAYLLQYGWPDIHQLNANLWRHLSADGAGETKLAEILKTGGAVELDEKTKKGVWEEWSAAPNRRVRLAVQSRLWEAFSKKDSEAAKSLWPHVAAGVDLRGDWYDLMMSLTEGNFDLVDALFVSLGKGRRPAAAHVFLAQLADALRVRLYLSLNFDPFLETALWKEGTAPNVIEVAKNSDLPSGAAVGDRLTVLKLHGGPYGLRIGERIYESADHNTLQRAADIIPETALVVVMGFSGDERRITQVLKQHCRRAVAKNLDAPSLLWMNFSKTPDELLESLGAEMNQAGKTPLAVRAYADTANFLLDVLVRLRGAHPAGSEQYRCLPTQPWAVAIPAAKQSGAASGGLAESEAAKRKAAESKSVLAFFRGADWKADGSPDDSVRGHSDASVKMAKFCAGKAKTHRVIWLDCEQHHTVNGVVVEILDAIRRYDPTFPPLLMQTLDTTHDPNTSLPSFDRPIERIREALQRGSYILCIDSPETIGRPQTVHHGTPSLALAHETDADQTQGSDFNNRVERFASNVQAFFRFLTGLLTDVPSTAGGQKSAVDLGDSFLCVAFAPAAPRHAKLALTDAGRVVGDAKDKGNGKKVRTALECVDQAVRELKEAVSSDKIRDFIGCVQTEDGRSANPIEIKNQAYTGFKEFVKDLNPESGLSKFNDTQVYMILSVFRRPRSHLAYAALRRPLASQATANDSSEDSASIWDKLFGSIDPSTDKEDRDFPHMYPRGESRNGHLIWLPRRAHNDAYNQISSSGIRVAKLLRRGESDKVTDDDARLSVLSLLSAMILHRRATRYCFSEVYESTGDLGAFREYVYHRISYLRYLCRFLIVSKHCKKISTDNSNEESRRSDEELRGLVAQSVSRYRAPDKNDRLGSESAWDDIRHEVRHAWRQELNAFRATLSREFDAVRGQLYAGTWVSIIERICVYDVGEMYDETAFTIRSGEEDNPYLQLCQKDLNAFRGDLDRQKLEASFEMADWTGVIQDQKRLLENADQDLNTLIPALPPLLPALPPLPPELHPLVQDIHLWVGKPLGPGDDMSATGQEVVPPLQSQKPGDQTRDDPPIKLETALPRPPQPQRTPADFVKWFMQLLDLSEGYLRLARVYHEMAEPRRNAEASDNPSPSAKLRKMYIDRSKEAAARLKEWLDTVERAAATADLIPPFSEEIQQFMRRRLDEHWLDVLSDAARYRFDKFNPYHAPEARKTRSRRPEPTFIAFLNGPKDDALRLFEQARKTVFFNVRAYNRYRSKSLRMVAWAEVLGATEPDDFKKPLADLNLALRLLARDGSPDPIETMACYLAKAETLMLCADVIARRLTGRGMPGELSVLAAARSRLASAHAMIGRGADAFDKRQRNVPWWLRLCRNRAQWSILSCVLRVFEARTLAPRPSSAANSSPDQRAVKPETAGSGPGGPPEADQMARNAEERRYAFETDLRFGLDAVRAGLDGILPIDGLSESVADRVKESTRSQWEEFVGQWLYLCRAAAAFDAAPTNAGAGFSGGEPPGGATPADAELQQFVTRWKLANENARLPFLCKVWSLRQPRVDFDAAQSLSESYSDAFDKLAPCQKEMGNELTSFREEFVKRRTEGRN